MLNLNRQVIGVKVETTQNSAATLAATDNMLAEEVLPDVKVETLKRNYRRTSIDSLTGVRGKGTATLKIKTELKGSGTAGTAYAPMDALLIACGMTETVVAATSVTLAPTSAPASSSFFTPGKSVTIEWYTDGLKMVFTGCVGNCKITTDAGQQAMLEFDMTGTFPTVTDAPPASASYLGQLPAVFVSSTILVHAFAGITQKWEIDFGNTITVREGAGSTLGVAGMFVSKREPKGTISIEAEKVATFDAIGKMKAGTEASASFTLGGTGGNIATVTLPKTQFTDVKLTNKNGIMVFDLPCQFNQNSGDDWVSIALT